MKCTIEDLVVHKLCSQCDTTKPLKDFHKRSDIKGGIRSNCKSCVNERNLAYYHSSLEKKDAHHKSARKSRYKTHYGISLEDYDEMLLAQDGVCAICRGLETSKRMFLSVDHCHTSGKVRGLLCSNCNRGLGSFKDQEVLLHKAIDYLERVQV